MCFFFLYWHHLFTWFSWISWTHQTMGNSIGRQLIHIWLTKKTVKKWNFLNSLHKKWETNYLLSLLFCIYSSILFSKASLYLIYPQQTIFSTSKCPFKVSMHTTQPQTIQILQVKKTQCIMPFLPLLISWPFSSDFSVRSSLFCYFCHGRWGGDNSSVAWYTKILLN